ncbi:MAG: M20/M25/M40 family metallo-hydrolase [Rhodothermales bacterium]|nr:M20/M25/M40 family metallo-hydrolase [Rhodothermales bacterium]
MLRLATLAVTGALVFITTGILSGGEIFPDSDDSIAAMYRADADKLIDAALADSSTYDRLAYLGDTFGARFSGSQNLEDAIDWILDEMRKDGLENVRGEEVMVPHWVRGEESLSLVSPRGGKMAILGLGGSIGTEPEGITAEVLVVSSFDDLADRGSEAEGKIVLFNVPFTTYGRTVQYRVTGANRASEAGAVASLVRSVGPASMYTPHTGVMRYEEGVRQIPHAAVTLEDAMMMQRMQDRGQKIVVTLKMGAETFPDVVSRNVVAEIVGSEFPEEVVVFGGHIDSWDVGQGVMDDAGGCVAAWQALVLMKRLGLRPKRTIRVVMWTNEENGLRGGTGYAERHADQVANHVLAMESDAGVFKPQGFGFTGSDSAFEIVTEIGTLLDRIESGTITRGDGGADIGPLMQQGVPGMGLRVDGTEYFWYHHTEADTMDKLDPHEINLCVATMAVMAYVAADLDERIPR